MEQREPRPTSGEDQVSLGLVSTLVGRVFECMHLIAVLSAHVRATTAGTLSLDNCHPWSYGKLMVRLFSVSKCDYAQEAPVVHAQRWDRRLPPHQAEVDHGSAGRVVRYGERKYRSVV